MEDERTPARRSYWKALRRSKDEIINVRADAVSRRTPLEAAIARMARMLAHPGFVLAEAALHGGWIVLNTGVVPGVEPWDPYPFSFLTGMASVQALFIGLLILMYAEQDSHVGELREEMDLQVALHSEREASKILRMLVEVQRALGVQSQEQDEELRLMSQPLDPAHLRQVTEEHLREAEEGES